MEVFFLLLKLYFPQLIKNLLRLLIINIKIKDAKKNCIKLLVILIGEIGLDLKVSMLVEKCS